MVTKIDIQRHHVITKESIENYCKGIELRKDSVNDDLESFFQDLQLGSEWENSVLT